MWKTKGIAQLLLFFVIIVLLWVSIQWEVNYLLLSFCLVIIAIFFLLFRFEKRKMDTREIVLLAILASIAAVGRIPFASIPSVQPTTFVIMMSGLIFGAESGLMIGVVAALASNMVLGQGPWTLWQMVSWGCVGLTAGYLGKRGLLNRVSARIFFGFIWGFLFGWIMNVWSLLAFSQAGTEINGKTILAYMASSAMFDFMHSISNVIFLVLFGDIWIKILSRFKRKYGLLE